MLDANKTAIYWSDAGKRDTGKKYWKLAFHFEGVHFLDLEYGTIDIIYIEL